MKFSVMLPYILGILMLTILLLLAEWYITAIVFCVIAIALVLLIVPTEKEPVNKEQITKRSTKSKKSNNFSRNDWDGFSDPNDFPTDGCGNNGW